MRKDANARNGCIGFANACSRCTTIAGSLGLNRTRVARALHDDELSETDESEEVLVSEVATAAADSAAFISKL